MASRKGSPNKATASKEAYYAKHGILPLDYMLKVLRDDAQPDARRDDMAKAAAPYVHPKLATVEQRHGDLDGKPLNATIKVEFVSPKKDTE